MIIYAFSKTTYGNTEYCSSIQKNNIFACQFHPEKSGEIGMNIYKNLKKGLLLIMKKLKHYIICQAM